jgi:hypothetical protein
LAVDNSVRAGGERILAEAVEGLLRDDTIGVILS